MSNSGENHLSAISGTAMTSRLRAFAAFWYDFVIGDDWRVALGVAVALAGTWVLSRATTGV